MSRDEALALQARIVLVIGAVVSALAVGCVAWACYEFAVHG